MADLVREYKHAVVAPEMTAMRTTINAQRERIAELEARLSEVANAYDVTFKRRAELELAIAPFVEFADHAVDVEQGVWKSSVHRESISTWFGPSDFAAVAKLKA